MTGRPRKTLPVHRVYLSMDHPDYELLCALAAEAGKPEATTAGQIVIQALRTLRDEAGQIDATRLQAILRSLRDEPDYRSSAPRWRWPLDVILADRGWWDRWYPELCKLLGRTLKLARPSQLGAGDAGPVLNRDGYADILEFLFPSRAGQRGAITWRSIDYPATVPKTGNESGLPLAPAWEAVIRHSVVALCALEESANSGNPNHQILTEDQIRAGWLSTLRSLVGEEALTLPRKRLS